MNWTRSFSLVAIATILLFATSSATAKEVIWHVKAIHPQGRALDIKDGKIHGVAVLAHVKALPQAPGPSE